jgi:sulfur relay (sulfurtransferase) complex TusBCD TusD component (DsrE family)
MASLDVVSEFCILNSALRMTRQERQEFLKILHAHAQTVAICEACATTTRDLAAEVARGSLPKAVDLKITIAEAERTLAQLAEVREEVERLMTAFGSLA